MESGCPRHRTSSENGRTKHIFGTFFFVFFGVRGPFGSRRVSGTEKSAKNGLDLVWNLARVRVVSALCGVFVRVFFWCLEIVLIFEGKEDHCSAHFGRGRRQGRGPPVDENSLRD